ncbi:MAG: VWA domain-containing protein [Clostridiales bacterium]|jgi:prepilin-type N-terminal cleavage/methylation domain-containing protein|nr:VWA domain-containing protein [Clostridiales bacterium]
MRSRKGFSLIELTVVVSVLSIVFLLAVELLQFSFKSLDFAKRDYDVQTSMRLAAQTAASKIRYSTGVFTIPKTSFRPDNLSPTWDYLGIEEVTIGSNPASQIVQYTWNDVTKSHDCAVLVAARADVTYSFIFSKEITLNDDSTVDNSNRQLNFQIAGYLNGDTSNPYIAIDGLSFAANSLQVIDSGTALNQATALAYRTAERTSLYVGHVAMVIDNSGSMKYGMSTSSEAPVGSQRVDYLRSAASLLINELAAHENIDISIIPFANSANNPNNFMNAKTNTAALLQIIHTLSPVGGTNTGDGIRRAYYQFVNHNPTALPAIAKNYLIVLVDGDTTFCSVKPQSTATMPNESNFFLDPGNVVYPDTYLYTPSSVSCSFVGSGRPAQVAGPGSAISALTKAYVTKCSQQFFTSTNFATPYVIAFSNSVSTEGLQNIASSLNATGSNTFRAQDAAQLTAAFTAIKDGIVNDLWFLNGPQL